jgi:hypothetical protein
LSRTPCPSTPRTALTQPLSHCDGRGALRAACQERIAESP